MIDEAKEWEHCYAVAAKRWSAFSEASSAQSDALELMRERAAVRAEREAEVTKLQSAVIDAALILAATETKLTTLHAAASAVGEFDALYDGEDAAAERASRWERLRAALEQAK